MLSHIHDDNRTRQKKKQIQKHADSKRSNWCIAKANEYHFDASSSKRKSIF